MRLTTRILPITNMLVLFLVATLPSLAAEGPYQPNWTSLSHHEAAPEWFQDTKLGIYFHWGVYCVPAHASEWYPRLMHLPGHEAYKHHLEKYGHPSKFGYHDFVPMFKAEKFDAEEWADLFQKTGARFAGPVAEHHDGFSMWDSEVTPWNVKAKGPKRDITGELARCTSKTRYETDHDISSCSQSSTLYRTDEGRAIQG